MNELKEIIVLYPSFERGGATNNLINFINKCCQENIKIYLISNINTQNKNIFFHKNVNLIPCYYSFKKIYFQRFFTSFLSIFKLYELFKIIKPKNSIIVSFQSHILPIIFCNFFRRKIVIRNSEDIIDATKYADNKISAYFIFFLKVLFYNFADGIITNSNKSKQSLKKIIFSNKVRMIHNPYLKKIDKSRKYLRKKYILCVGRLCKQKNQIISLKAFSDFSKKYQDYKLILIGHGPDEFKLKKICSNLKISKKVLFKGWVNNPKKYYLNSKVLIFPSLYEGLPNTLIDAVNHDLPCISSRCSGAVDILTEKYGLFTPNNNFKILASKIEYVINNYNNVTSNTFKIKKKLNRFLINLQTKQYLNYLKKIIN